jgi:hypothetical protein
LRFLRTRSTLVFVVYRLLLGGLLLLLLSTGRLSASAGRGPSLGGPAALASAPARFR